MTAALDEARLRELAEALTFFGRYADETREATATRRNNNANDASKAILALLDTLSAERERGDRAVGLLDSVTDDLVSEIVGRYDGLLPQLHSRYERDMSAANEARAFLATQSPSRTGEG